MPNIFEGAHLFDHAKVTGNAMVFGNCRIFGNARIYGDAQIYEDAKVSGNALIYADGRVYGTSRIYGEAQVAGQSRVYGDARIFGSSFIHGQAQIQGTAQVSGSAQIFGAAQILGDASVTGNARIYGNARISGDSRVYGDVQIRGFALIESSQHWFSFTQGNETMSVYRSSRPGGFEINIEGQEASIDLLDEDLGRFVQKTIESNFDLLQKKSRTLRRSDAESAASTKPEPVLIRRHVPGLSFHGDGVVTDTSDTEAIRAFSSSSSRSISNVIPASNAKTRIPFCQQMSMVRGPIQGMSNLKS